MRKMLYCLQFFSYALQDFAQKVCSNGGVFQFAKCLALKKYIFGKNSSLFIYPKVRLCYPSSLEF